MHNALPPLDEEVTALKTRLPHAHDGHQQPRLQMRSLLARGQAHRRQGMGLVFLPPYGPALNPMERAWRALKAALARLPFPTLDGPQDDVATRRRGQEAAMLQALTAYPSLAETMHALR